MTQQALFFVNEGSGRVLEEGTAQVEADLRAALPPNFSAEFVIGNAASLVERATDRTAAMASDDAVVTVGGDGTIGAISAVLAAIDRPPLFVPLPFGTANLIPRDLGLPLEPAEALNTALIAPQRRIDYATANGRPLLHSAVFGTFAEIAEEREQMRDAADLGERMAAISAAAQALFGTRPLTYELEIDGRRLDAETNAVFVTNNAVTGGRFGVPERARLDGGELIVYVSDSMGPLGFVRRIVEAGTGGLADSPGVDRYACREAVIRTTRSAPYSRDGEIVEDEREIAFAIDAGALIVPDLRG